MSVLALRSFPAAWRLAALASRSGRRPISDSKSITIGDVTKDLRPPKNPELVPVNYLPKEVPPETKKVLEQDQLSNLLLYFNHNICLPYLVAPPMDDEEGLARPGHVSHRRTVAFKAVIGYAVP